MPTKAKFELFGQNVLVIAGKGGTGRTTLARILAKIASMSGRKVAVIAGTTGTHFTETHDPLISFTSLEPGEVLISYLDQHGLSQLGKRLSSSGLASIISTAVPGIADLLVLAKIKQMEQAKVADLIIFDAPASGHFLRLIATPMGLSNIAAAGPLQKQSQEVLELIQDPARLGIAMVTIPEETPVKETIETVTQLKITSGLEPRALFINSLMPNIPQIALKKLENTPLSAPYLAGKYTEARNQTQMASKTSITNSLKLKAIEIPQVPTADLDEGDIENLAYAVSQQIEKIR